MKKLSCLLSEFIPRIGGSYCPSKPLVRFILKRKGFSIDPLTFDKEALNLLIAQDKIVGPFDCCCVSQRYLKMKAIHNSIFVILFFIAVVVYPKDTEN